MTSPPSPHMSPNDGAAVSPLKASHIGVSMGIGAISGVIAGFANTFWSVTYLPIGTINPYLYLIVVISFVAPFVEEQAKLLGLYLLRFEEGLNLSLKNWVICGAFSGLGFALLENLVYAQGVAIAGGLGYVFLVLVIRMLLSVPLHMIATSTSSFGFGLWQKTSNARYYVLLLLFAMLIHGFYNLTTLAIEFPASSGSNDMLWLVYLAALVSVFVGLGIVYHFTVGKKLPRGTYRNYSPIIAPLFLWAAVGWALFTWVLDYFSVFLGEEVQMMEGLALRTYSVALLFLATAILSALYHALSSPLPDEDRQLRAVEQTPLYPCPYCGGVIHNSSRFCSFCTREIPGMN